MYRNLMKLMDDKRITNKAMANLLRRSPNTIADKIRGRSDFDVQEALTISRTYFPEYDLSFVFERDEHTA